MSEPNIGIIGGWTLPWPEIRIPPYQTGRVGAWQIKRQMQPVLRGYFRGLQACTENYLLMRDNRVWMSLSPVEIESLAPHVSQMRGLVVIAGLGMGLALYNALLRPAVRRITVLECDTDVIALFTAMIPREMSGSGRFSIEQTDARDWRTAEPVDFLYADIWDKIGAPEAVADTRIMCRNSAAEICWLLGNGSGLCFVSRKKPVQAAGDAIAVSKLGPCARRPGRRVQQPRVAHANSRRGNTADLRRLARSEYRHGDVAGYGFCRPGRGSLAVAGQF